MNKIEAERLKTIAERQEANRVELSEIYRFHKTEECPDCGRELPDADDDLECGCGFTRFIPFHLQEEDPEAKYQDRTADNRTDWGPSGRVRPIDPPAPARDTTPKSYLRGLAKRYGWHVVGWKDGTGES